jgi:hypothetical protein
MTSLKNKIKDTLKSIPIINHAYKTHQLAKANQNFPTDFSHLDVKDKQVLDHILNKGYYVFDGYYSPEWCDACAEKIKQVVNDDPEFVHKNEDRRLYGSENLEGNFRDYFAQPYFQFLSDTYYGQKTEIGVQLSNWIWAEKGKTKGSGGDWHRDRFERQFKTVVYLTDVTEKTGAFQMIEGSNTNHFDQLKKDMKNSGSAEFSARMTDEEVMQLVKNDKDRLKTFAAQKGTVLLIDTSAIHRGAPLSEGERLAIFNYYYPHNPENPTWYLDKFSPRVPKGY